MAWAMSAAPSLLQICRSSPKFSFPVNSHCSNQVSRLAPFPAHSSQILLWRNPSFSCKAEKEYKFPDPIPEFADSEIDKFETHLFNKLKKKDIFGDSLDEVVGICTGILDEFLHTEYGGPGTLLVNPFVDMAYAINERGLPGGPQAARIAIKWAQANVDKDWKEWTSS